MFDPHASPEPNPLYSLLSDARFPPTDPPHSGGVEEAVQSGLVTTPDQMADFLHGRLLTMGTTAAFAAAAVCARAERGAVPDPVWRAFESEIDARILSPVARDTSRQQGAALLRRALAVRPGPALRSLARATSAGGGGPHHSVVIGTVAASAGARPEEAAASAAAASMAGALYAGRHLLSLSSVEFEKITAAIDNGITLLSVEAARFSRQSVSELPAWIAPGLEFLAEEHARRERSVFAS